MTVHPPCSPASITVGRLARYALGNKDLDSPMRRESRCELRVASVLLIIKSAVPGAKTSL